MKKKIFIALIFSIFLFPIYVSAQGHVTCDYKGSYAYEKYGNVEKKDITITCTLYEDGGHSCNVSTSKYKQSISNWSSQIGGVGFTAKYYFNENKSCLPYMIFLDKGSVIDRYEIFGADTYERAVSISTDLGGKSTDYFYGITSLTNSESVGIEPNGNSGAGSTTQPEEDPAQRMYDKIVAYTNLANKVNTSEDPWELNGCLTEQGGLDPNAANFYVCKNKLQQFYDDINNWKQEVQDAVDSGLIDKNDSRVQEFYKSIETARSNVNENTDGGIKDADKPDMSIGTGSSGSVECNSIFAGTFGEILQNILDLIEFAVPLIIIGLSVVDYMKALLAQNQDELKKANQRLIKRLIIGVVVFALPVILEFLMGIANSQCPNLPIK